MSIFTHFCIKCAQAFAIKAVNLHRENMGLLKSIEKYQ